MKKLTILLIALLVLVFGCASQEQVQAEEVNSKHIYTTGLDGSEEGWQCMKIHDGSYSNLCIEWK